MASLQGFARYSAEHIAGAMHSKERKKKGFGQGGLQVATERNESKMWSEGDDPRKLEFDERVL